MVQNALLKAAAVVFKITDEIKDAEGFAVIANEARDIDEWPGIWCSTKAQGDRGEWMCLYPLPCT